MNRYKNKRIMLRTASGKFRKSTPADMGIGGVCPKCRHLLLRHYDGDPTETFIDPRKFRYRCFTCEPKTEAEKAREAEELAKRENMFVSFFDEIIKRSK